MYGVENNSKTQSTTEQPKDAAAKEDSEEPPSKKSKKNRRGQNKKRPFNVKRADASLRLCPRLVYGEKCQFGEKCMFSHNIAKLVREKPPDIGSVCYNFETYGKCLRGIMCRYGSAHISEDFQNIVDEEKWNSCKDKSVTTNIISKDVQSLLRKRKFKYVKSDKYLADMAKERKQKKQNQVPCGQTSGNSEKKDASSTKVASLGTDNGVKEEEIPPELIKTATESTDTKADQTEAIESDSTRTAVEPSEKLDPKSGLNMESSTTSSQLGEVSSGLDAGYPGDKVPCQESSIQTSGVVTDEDLIKLRSCEKKTIDFRDKLYLAPLTTVSKFLLNLEERSYRPSAPIKCMTKCGALH